MILAYAILFIVYMCCPKYLKAIACVINFVSPDPVPGIDEAVMVLGLLS